MKFDSLLKSINNYENNCLESLAKIRKLPNGDYRVLSEKGKNLGTFDSKEKASSRLKQVEFFKHKDSHSADSKEKIDLTKMEDFSLSAAMRQLRQNGTKEQARTFLKIFKGFFDKAIKNKSQKPDQIALQKTFTKFNKLHPVKLDKELVKDAAISELGNPILVGKYLADIIIFAKKDNGIELVKETLANHDSKYVQEVLNHILKSLDKTDNNSADIVSNERDSFGDNKDSYLDTSRQMSFAPYLNVTRQFPYDAVYRDINDQSPTRENYNEPIKEHNSEQTDIPSVGIYNNDAGISGAGPVISPGGFIYE